jgi:hypothetical protein
MVGTSGRGLKEDKICLTEERSVKIEDCGTKS